jgi:chemotaxis response regulator CheB
MSNSFRVAVIDDHPMFRDGVVNMLMRAGDIEVVGEGATAADALRIAQEHSPDVMLLDLQMAGGGIEAASNLAHAHPDMRIVMLTASERDCCPRKAAGSTLSPTTIPTILHLVKRKPWHSLRRASPIKRSQGPLAAPKGP